MVFKLHPSLIVSLVRFDLATPCPLIHVLMNLVHQLDNNRLYLIFLFYNKLGWSRVIQVRMASERIPGVVYGQSLSLFLDSIRPSSRRSSLRSYVGEFHRHRSLVFSSGQETMDNGDINLRN